MTDADLANLSDVALAAELARRSGELLLRIRDGGLSGKELGKKGDQDSNALLCSAIVAARPEDAILSEESPDTVDRLTADRVWIIDPLDGTREYGMPGRDDWAVHVALWERGQGLTASAVALPSLGIVHSSADEFPERPAVSDPGIILISASRPPSFVEAVATAISGKTAPMGSAGAKTMAVVRNEAVAYVHAGGQWEWDSAAPVGVALAAGLHCSRIDGRPMEYNCEDPYLPDLLICRPELAPTMLDTISRLAAETTVDGPPPPRSR